MTYLPHVRHEQVPEQDPAAFDDVIWQAPSSTVSICK